MVAVKRSLCHSPVNSDGGRSSVSGGRWIGQTTGRLKEGVALRSIVGSLMLMVVRTEDTMPLRNISAVVANKGLSHAT